jgi:hypothetical protein
MSDIKREGKGEDVNNKMQDWIDGVKHPALLKETRCLWVMLLRKKNKPWRRCAR